MKNNVKAEQRSSISVVIPVHNEEAYLPYSLPSFKAIEGDVDEFIFVLDNCTDRSEEIIRRALPQAKILIKTGHKWRFFAAESFQYGFDRASGDIILAAGADLILDPKIPRIIRKIFIDPSVGTVCFRYLNFDLFSLKMRIHGHYENIYKTLIQKFRREARHTGFYAFRRKMMMEIGGLADIVSEYDEYCRRAEKHGWKVIYVPYTKTLHLRPGLSSKKQYIQGTARATLPSYNLFKTAIHSFIHFKPYLLVGFIHARRYGVVESGKLGHA